MTPDLNGFWQRVKEAFAGWRAIAATASVTFVATTVGLTALGDLWAAPKVAEQALDRTRVNADSIQSNRERISGTKDAVKDLERTVRIVACTQGDIDRSTRIRLRCREFD